MHDGRVSAEIRPMTVADVSASRVVFEVALNSMREAAGFDPYYSDRLDGGILHLLDTDPAGSYVAVDENGLVVGFAQAARRDDLWVMAHLFVSPECQGLGVGSELLRKTFWYGAGASSGIVASTPDPRAIRAYARLAGFEVHPMLQASGTIDARFSPSLEGVREGTAADLDFAAHVDRSTRGGPHGPDLDYHLANGGTLLVLPDRGYAIASMSGPDIVAALDNDAGATLLHACLSICGQEAEVHIKRIGASHQWAVQVALAAGLALRPWGPLITWNSAAATSAYLPDSAFC
jgi:ribosomal protein S18 acetylase RimI-like enzyme